MDSDTRKLIDLAFDTLDDLDDLNDEVRMRYKKLKEFLEKYPNAHTNVKDTINRAIDCGDPSRAGAYLITLQAVEEELDNE